MLLRIVIAGRTGQFNPDYQNSSAELGARYAAPSRAAAVTVRELSNQIIIAPTAAKRNYRDLDLVMHGLQNYHDFTRTTRNCVIPSTAGLSCLLCKSLYFLHRAE